MRVVNIFVLPFKDPQRNGALCMIIAIPQTPVNADGVLATLPSLRYE
jgi:hypothetical protein